MTPMEKITQLEKKIDALKNTIGTLVSGIDTISEQLDSMEKMLTSYHDAVLNVPPDIGGDEIKAKETASGDDDNVWPS